MNTLEASILLEEALEILSQETADWINIPAEQAHARLLAFRDGWFRFQRESAHLPPIPRHPPKAPPVPTRRYMGTTRDE